MADEHHDHDHSHAHDHAPAHDHSHAHNHGAELRETPARRLAFALALTAAFMVVEILASVWTHSLALLSDAVHMLTDAGALALALVAQRIARKLPSAHRTYGYRRAETLAAFVNGIALAASSVWIVLEAIGRWSRPPSVLGRGMMAVAVGGLVVNLASAWVLSRGSAGHNTNTRAALAHVMADAVGSVAAIAAGAAVTFLGWNRADPAISLALAVLILWGAWRLVRETVDVLMEGAPVGLEVARIDAVIRATTGVRAAHDLHVWTVAEGFPVVTVHVELTADAHGVTVAREVSRRLRDELKIEHVTVQPEAPAPASIVPESALVRRRR